MKEREQIKVETFIGGNPPTCLLWPDCGCAKTIIKYQEELQTNLFTLEQLEWIEDLIYTAVACAAKHCPNKADRDWCMHEYCVLSQRPARNREMVW